MSRAAFLQLGGIVRGIASVVFFLLVAAGLASIPAARLVTSCSDDPSANAVVCIATEDQDSLYGASDGSGGAVVAWQAPHDPAEDIYTEEVLPSCVVNHPPAQPSNASPVDGEEGVILAPTLKSWAFSDPDAADTHYASQWRITTTPGDYGDPVFLSPEVTSDLTQITVPSDLLASHTTYHWQVRHQDSEGDWSEWSVETSFTTLNRPPNQPDGTWPQDGASDASLTLTLESSAFSDPDAGDTHAASEWRITVTSGDYSSPVFDTGADRLGLLQVTVEPGRLNGNTLYYWQVRHQDNHELWSPWSQEVSFTTLNQPPARPSGVSPGDAECGVGLTPTLRSSAFSDPDTGDSHAASQWRMTTVFGDYSAPVFLSAEVTTDLTEITITGSSLAGDTTYYWQVRHKDSHAGWSEWSEEISFTTLNRPPERPATVSPLPGTTSTSLSLTLESSAFSDPDIGDTHAASHWQITTNAGDYDSPIFDNAYEAVSSLTSIAVTACSLNPGTTYFWRVRYQDNHGAWSDWSRESSFATQSGTADNPPINGENHPPDRPVCIAPEDGAKKVSTTPTLESSAFQDPDVGDSQAASQWQITTTSSDYQGSTVDRLESLTSVVFPEETLSPQTTYYWRVRYQDSHGTWSDWSEESSFTTRAGEASGTANKTNAATWIYLGAIVAVAVLAITVVAWRNARATATATQ